MCRKFQYSNPPKQTYGFENGFRSRSRNRGKTTSVDSRKRETQTVKLNLVVFGFETFPRKKPPVWTSGFENQPIGVQYDVPGD